MAIPDSQLKTWSNQGAKVTSASTHKTVENCIKGHHWKDDVKFVTYLQGSYPNYTNIYGNSDVDLVVEFRSIFSKSLTKLTDEQKAIYNSKYNTAKYTLDAFKTVVVKRLKTCFGEENIEVGDKAILVKGGGKSGRLDCDVLVCNPYRKYNSITKDSDDYIEGILFKTEETKVTIINYPKVHIKNGSIKNSDLKTNGSYKPTIRILKNIKAAMVDKKYITKEIAPSYFLECLLYNSNDANFKNTTYHDDAFAILSQFRTDLINGNMKDYLVQNEQRKLFGNENQQWNMDDAKTFVNQIIKFWNEY